MFGWVPRVCVPCVRCALCAHRVRMCVCVYGDVVRKCVVCVCYGDVVRVSCVCVNMPYMLRVCYAVCVCVCKEFASRAKNCVEFVSCIITYIGSVTSFVSHSVFFCLTLLQFSVLCAMRHLPSAPRKL